ncbi:MSMEG_4193 family putative phosphomutase [Actinotalea solisilvae]|uniref:MSMEG_4193 family putative phosphomutase n=1 Tax=Actinotalea solisilvae TaxID=2072922 RepID=UPI0018F2050A|nr:MSMEG_4193 family putative phosphomutase [Actinotalea solisilvae]
MATVILVRHGRTAANTAGILAGRAPGVGLDDVGRGQAERAAQRLAVVPLVGVVTSPLERCRRTAEAVVDRQRAAAPLAVDDGLTECDYGAWQGRALRELATEPLWTVVQQQPSAVTFPDGESMRAMQARAVAAVRGHDAAVEAEHGAGAVWAAVSHGDVIKAVLADALGMHLDVFQRIAVGPASLSVVRYGASRPEVVGMNLDDGDLSWLASAAPVGDAAVGGGAGHAADGERVGAAGTDTADGRPGDVAQPRS